MRRLGIVLLLLSGACTTDPGAMGQRDPVEITPGGASTIHFQDDVYLRFGNTSAAPDCWFEWDTAATDDFELKCTNVDGGGTDGIIYSVDEGTDDVVFVGNITTSAGTVSAEQLTTTDDATVTDDLAVNGDANFSGSATNGQLTSIKSTTETLTFAANPGDASKTTSSLIPDGAILLGVTGRVTTVGTNCSDMDIGDGSDADIFGDAISVAANTTFGPANHTANIANPQLAAGNVTVTGTNGAGAAINCYGMVVKVTAHYLTLTAATSN